MSSVGMSRERWLETIGDSVVGSRERAEVIWSWCAPPFIHFPR